MTLEYAELEELSPRELATLIENAGDALADHDEASDEASALGLVTAEVGHKVKAIDSGRIK